MERHLHQTLPGVNEFTYNVFVVIYKVYKAGAVKYRRKSVRIWEITCNMDKLLCCGKRTCTQNNLPFSIRIYSQTFRLFRTRAHSYWCFMYQERMLLKHLAF